MCTDGALEGMGYVPLDGVQYDGTASDAPHRTACSPPDYFQGENRKFQPPADLDHFFQRVYRYYCDKGFWCIVTQWVMELLTLGFTIIFSGFLMLFVNWPGLLSARCGVAAAEEGEPPCNLVEEGLNKDPLRPFTLFRAVVLGYLFVFSLYWLYCFVRFFVQLRDTLEIRDFCHKSLEITDRELQTMAWPALVDSMVAHQKQQRLCIARNLTAHDMVSRIMRKENYMIGMLNKGVLGMDIPAWFPGAGPASGGGMAGPGQRLLLTKTVEWSLQWCILHHMFDQNFLIRKDFSSNSQILRKRFRAVGLLMLALSPFLSIFLFIYFFLRNAERFYHHPTTAGSRRWSNLAKWKFREFNELEHLFVQRLNTSYQHAAEYGKQFPSPIISMVAKFVSFVAGAFAAVLLAMALVDESLLEAQIWGRNLLWYAAILGTILAISRSLVTEENTVFDPEGCMYRIVCHTHYLPKHWRGAANTDLVRAEFEALFQFKAILFLEEMISIFVTPFLLWFCLPKCVNRILQFVQEFTVHVEGVGHVCSLSVFDFELHGNSKYGSPFHASKYRRSSQGKMEKSFIGFKSHYPNWEPDFNGKEFLSRLSHLQEQNLIPNAGMPHPSTSSHLSTSSHGTLPGGFRHQSQTEYDYQQKNFPCPMPFSSHDSTGKLATSAGVKGVYLDKQTFVVNARSVSLETHNVCVYDKHQLKQRIDSPASSWNFRHEKGQDQVNYEQVNDLFGIDRFYMSESAVSAASRHESESEGRAHYLREDCEGEEQKSGNIEHPSEHDVSSQQWHEGVGMGMRDSAGTEAEFFMAEKFIGGLQNHYGHGSGSSPKSMPRQGGPFVVPFRDMNPREEQSLVERERHVCAQDTDDSEEDREREWVTRRLSSQRHSEVSGRSGRMMGGRQSGGEQMEGVWRRPVDFVLDSDKVSSINIGTGPQGERDGRASPPLLFGDVYREAEVGGEEALWLVQRAESR